MLAWENSGFSIDASVRVSLIDRDVPSYFQSLEHPHGGGWIMVGRAWAARDLLAELPLWASEYLFRFRLCERTAFVLNLGHGHCF